MKRLVWGLSGLLLVVAASLLVKPAPAAAATEGFNVITSPLPIKLTTAPGRTVTTELRMKNQGTQSEGIKMGLMKFGATGELGQPNLFELTSKDTYAKWVHFSPSEFVAEPNVWKTVKMTIDVPPDAALGYYLAVTFSRSSQPGVPEAANFKGAAATLVLLEVKTPNEKRALQLLDFKTDHSLYEYLPVNFKVRLHNSGNIYIAPAGNIFILKGDKPVSTLVFNEAGGSVLPSSNRQLSVPWQDGFPVFKDRIVNGKPVPDKNEGTKKDLKWDFSQASKFRFGHYTAKLLVVYDNGTSDVPLESTLSFWVLPWKLMLVLLLIILAIGFGLWTLLRSFIRRTRSGTSKVSRLRRPGGRKPHDKA